MSDLKFKLFSEHGFYDGIPRMHVTVSYGDDVLTTTPLNQKDQLLLSHRLLALAVELNPYLTALTGANDGT